MTKPPTTLAARWVFPVVGKPIYGGWVRFDGQQIVEVGQGSSPAGAIDLGDVALLPQLVNAHTHLEFSDCRKPIGHVGVPLYDWVGQVIVARNQVTAEVKNESIVAGLAESASCGVGLVGDIATPPQAFVTVPDDVDVVSFAETIGLSEQRFAERLDAATEHLQTYPSAAISPHAPYSTNPTAIKRCVELANQHNCSLAMHVAESPAERELLCSGEGPFAERLKTLGVWRDGMFPWSLGRANDPFRHLITLLAKAPRALLVHCNDLRASEIDRIAQHPSLAVAFCPRTHAFFGYDRHPVVEMMEAGIPVALGTDSRASNPDLNVWKEVQYLLRSRADIDPQQILRMATAYGADALGRHDLGRIEVGCQAKFGCVKTQANSLKEVFADFAINEFQPLG